MVAYFNAFQSQKFQLRPELDGLFRIGIISNHKRKTNY